MVLEDQRLERVEAQPEVVLVAAHRGGEGVRYPVWAWGCRWRREVDDDRHLRAESRAAGRSPPGRLFRVGGVTQNTLGRGLLGFGLSGFRV